MSGDWIDDIGEEVTGMAKTRRGVEEPEQHDAARLSATADLLLADMAGEWVRHKRRRRWGTWLFRALVIGLLVVIAVGLLRPAVLEGQAPQTPFTATVSLTGVVVDGQEASADSLRTRLTAALEDDYAVGVLLLIDSPGGSPVQAGLMYDIIKRLRDEYPEKPIHAVIGNMAASAGYYIAAAAENIYANQASLVGSIGVRLDSFGAVDAMQRLGIERRLLTAGEHKGLLDPFSPEDDKAVAHMQSVLDSVHQQFIQAVKAGRGNRLTGDSEVFTGLVWNGEQAVELGLVDELSDAHSVAKDVLGAEELVPFAPEKSFLEGLSDELASALAAAFSQEPRWR